jgi:gliding motility-associated lipoprotein GldD
MKNSGILSFLFLIGTTLLTACNSAYTPRPKGYFKIDLPERSYRKFDSAGFPYSFEYPVYAEIVSVDSLGKDPYWVNVEIPSLRGRIYVSYKPVNGYSALKVNTAQGYRDSLVKNSFERLREEAYTMTYKHTIKASGIVDSAFINPFGSGGVYFYVAGEAATSKQFYITDTGKHFLRAALYFDATPNEDSLSVVSSFLETDMRHLISTLKWK